jgi:hypothetical protein
VSVAERALPARERFAETCLGAGQVSRAIPDQRQIVDRADRLCVIGWQEAAADLQGPDIEGLCFVETTLRFYGKGQAVECIRHPGMAIGIRLLLDSQHFPLQSLSLTILAAAHPVHRKQMQAPHEHRMGWVEESASDTDGGAQR